MRVTLQMKTDNSIYNINKAYSKLNKLNNDLASGVCVSKASDNPTAAYTALRYELMTNQSTTYISNIKTGDLMLGQSDNSLNSVNTVLTKSKAIVTTAANDISSQSVLDGYAIELRSYLEALVSLANTTSAGQYLFGGTSTNQAPYEVVDDFVLFKGNEQDIKVETANNVFTAVNVSGSEAFGNLTTTLDSAKLTRLLNLSTNNSTRLEDLNSGNGVQGETLTLCWSSATEGMNIDISSADTLADVAVLIEQATLEQGVVYAEETGNLVGYALKVQLNEEGDGLELIQYGYDVTTDPPTEIGVVDLSDTVTYPGASVIRVRDTLAGEELGLISSSSTINVGTTTGSSLVGYDLKAAVSSTTLLSDLANWDDSTYIIYNGDEPDITVLTDLEGTDSYLSQWNLTGIAEGENVSEKGDLYYEVIVDTTAGTSQINIYNDPDKTEASMIATGISAESVVLLEEVNNSGVNGSVLVAAPSATGTYDGELVVTFDNPFTTAVSVKAFEESGTPIAGLTGVSTDSLASSWEIHGLEQGVVPNSTTGTTGNELYVSVDCTAAPSYVVNVYLDEAQTTLVASGTCGSAAGTVSLIGATGYEGIDGQVDISIPASLAGTYNSTLTTTFNTVGDFMETINASSTYVNAAISEDGNSLELTSRLSGAYLRVSQNYENAVVSGDENEQLVQLDLQGVTSGINSDSNGNLYTTITSDTTGTATVYSVNVYSDSDCTELVASGSSTNATGALVLAEVDGSGLSGSVYLQYIADDDTMEVSAKGRSSVNDEYDQISQIDLTGLVDGITADYAGNAYVDVSYDGTDYTVNVYKDSAHKLLVATGSIATATGEVALTEVLSSGVNGTIWLDYTQDDADIVLVTGTTELNGQEREQNIFSLFTDAINAIEAGVPAEISDLLADFSAELDRIVSVRAQIGSTQNLLTLFENRHELNINTYTAIVTAAVSTDVTTTTTQYASAKTTYEAALSVSATAMTTNLFDYI